MTKVFIAGSRRLLRLDAEVTRRIDTMIRKGVTILVGDANGADAAVQRYLADKGYRDAIVYCMAGNCRNNVAGWPVHEVSAPTRTRDFAYYATKDKAMVDDAACGLMLWDGESKGTLNSVINLVRLGKRVVVYLAQTKEFHKLRSFNDVRNLLSNCDRASVQRLERELGIAEMLNPAQAP